ncbi:phosphate cytidylyltransferase beta isoform [Vairimorpha apis BRL 01]|uniref:choline-phosphate cytidylyltransferase n=1 Tax=Vairimorpha apis BRL 01 TaxID=1037528 RepID=T0MFJ7_9MICR|nr:phosphate cytidylyltransferase beta isoform [Vairimorpha apis BRL 01]
MKKPSKLKNILPKYPTENVFEFISITSTPIKYKIPVDRPVRIYCDGVYDLFHYGHARSLQQAKNLFPNVYLIVGLTSDKLTEELKGPTVMNEKERAESLKHCKYVDEIIENAPWVITDEYLEKHQIDFVAHDESPYQFGDCDDIYAPLKHKNMFIPLKRTKGISTSGIITNIVRDYDKFVIRNLDRGCSPKELNISFIQLNTIKMKKHVDEIIKVIDIHTKINNIKIEFKVANKYWDNVIHRLVEKFQNLRNENRIFLNKIREFIK